MEFRHVFEGHEGRIFVDVDGHESGFIKYELMPNNNLKANGTLVYDAYRDQKLGMPLFDELVKFASNSDKKIYPTCPFVVKMFQRHPELADLLDPDFKF